MIRFLTALIVAACAISAQAAVDVNQASQAELETVKGIGPGLSGKILDARKSGAFKDWTDLVDRIGGVGPGNAAKFSQAGLTVGNVAYNGAPVATTDKADKARMPDAPAAKPGSAVPKPAAR